jgi:hypothetical protein
MLWYESSLMLTLNRRFSIQALEVLSNEAMHWSTVVTYEGIGGGVATGPAKVPGSIVVLKAPTTSLTTASIKKGFMPKPKDETLVGMQMAKLGLLHRSA